MKLRIGHLDYVVRPYADGDPHYGSAYGLTRTVQQEILLDSVNTPERQLETLIHEILHGYADAFGHVEREFTEEQLCKFAGCALAAAFLNNRHLLPVLIAMRDGAGFVEQSE
jgi:hypothetical protein